MPYVKPTVHLSRLAGTALKSFTHGYAQTVVAASQSSHAAQNTQATPLYDTLLGRFRKVERSRVSHAHQVGDLSRQTGAGASGKNDAGIPDHGLEKYLDAWQKYQKNELKDWQQFQLAKRIEWQPPTTVPSGTETGDRAVATDAAAQENVEVADEPESAPRLKRSYTTSALDNFGKAFGNDAEGEAEALERVNNAIAEEVRLRDEDTSSAKSYKADQSRADNLENAKGETSVETAVHVQQPDHFTARLLELVDNSQYAEVPIVFRDMLLAGVTQPSPAAYRTLLRAVLGLSNGKHQIAPKALELYADMLRRKVTPDGETFSMLIDLLARRTTEIQSSRESLESRLKRYGGLQGPGQFLLPSSQSEHSMALEDSSLNIAMKLFERSLLDSSDSLSEQACTSLVIACAKHGQIQDMTRVHEYMLNTSFAPQSAVFASMIAAYGAVGDLFHAIELYDNYKSLAIAQTAGEISFDRDDYAIYASVIKAYGSADRLKGGLKFLSSIQAGISDPEELAQVRKVVSLEALLPLTLTHESLDAAFDLADSLPSHVAATALSAITTAAADRDLPDASTKAFELLSELTHDTAEPAAAMLAMHVRNANLEAAERFWRILENATASFAMIEPTVMRAVALIGSGQAEAGIRQSRRMFTRVREQQDDTTMPEALEQIDEGIELLGAFLLKASGPMPLEASIELLRTMIDNGGLFGRLPEHIVARFGPEQIARLNAADVDVLTRIQAGMILEETTSDIASAARFGCLLENITTRSLMPSTVTEDAIERTLVNLGRADLSERWNSYRYPRTPASFESTSFTPAVAFQPYSSPTIDDSFDPYASRTDIRGSNLINELLERPQGRRMNEALAKFRNMRRVGRVPRMFTYGKLIESAAKENNLSLASEILQLAKQDVPFDARYRVVRHGWQQILDHMVAGCLTVGRRDLAARYHQDLLDMGAAPSANTFGLYITTLKEGTKTFDEASEAVKIFLRARSEGVEPTSFLYNALIGKLGKARRIDDCLFYFAEMRNLGVRPTSVTYGTIVNALCRVSDEKFAEEIFEEMEGCANYKARPAPYHSLMQYFLTTKRDRTKVLEYYERMRSRGIEPTMHTYKLLIDTHATIEPIDMPAAEAVLAEMRSSNASPEAVHYASLIHAKGCVLHDMAGARQLFDDVIAEGRIRPQPCLYQALFEAMNANHLVTESDALLADMTARRVEFTPYIANALIHGWTLEKDVVKARAAFERVPLEKREPSTYEAMVRAYLAAADRPSAKAIVREALSRGYPSAVATKIAELIR